MAIIKRRGLMLVLSSPSGSGKTTLANLLLESDKHTRSSISYTTRPPRPNETNGKSYHFVTKDVFEKTIFDGGFLEYAEVFENMYGTPRKLVEEYLLSGEDVIFDIEWQGHRNLKKLNPEDVVSVFILPPSKKELRARLIKRASDVSENIELRLRKANTELQHWQEYDYVIVNKDLKDSLRKLLTILRAERLRKQRRIGVAGFVDQLIYETEEY
jgi:guanylate kinase